MGNRYLDDELFQSVKGTLGSLLMIADKESNHYVKFEGVQRTGGYYTMGKSESQGLCICSSDRTVMTQIDETILDISVAQFILDIDLFYRLQKSLPKRTVPLISNTHKALLDFLDAFPLFKKQFNQQVKMMIDENDFLIKSFYDDTETTYL
ncbi:hypothetical protein [Lactococcus lactis]